jgi:diguanylate cyclase (GGDEF)-like protein
MIDADHFKSYNDRFGHQAGDELLVALGRCIAANTQRATDFAARYGGEEFVVLLTGADAPDATRLGERICQAVAAMTEGPGGALLAPVTVSIGVACIIPDARAIHQDLLGAAATASSPRRCSPASPRRAWWPDARCREPEVRGECLRTSNGTPN